jgi:hypothetical protein
LHDRDASLTQASGAVFHDHRVIRWNFPNGDGTNPRHYTFSSDPRTSRIGLILNVRVRTGTVPPRPAARP